jgi:hypothetical protein
MIHLCLCLGLTLASPLPCAAVPSLASPLPCAAVPSLASPLPDTPVTPLPDNTEVVFLGVGDPTIITAPTLGETSFPHTFGEEEDVLSRLRTYALSHGANLVRITTDRLPSRRGIHGVVSARIYKVPNVHLYESWIDWSADRHLTPADFKGLPSPPSPSHSDCTFYLLPYTHETTNGFVYTRTRFYTHSSWIDHSVRTPNELLQHEQGEFDLCELYRRKLDTVIFSSAGNFYRRALRERAYRQIYAEYLRMREQYDTATLNGLDDAQQDLWNKRIAAGDLPDVPIFTYHQLDRQAHTLQPTDSLALIYVIRPNRYNTPFWKRMVINPYWIVAPYCLFVNLDHYSITVNDVTQGPISARKFIYRYVRPGTCNISSTNGETRLTLRTDPGKVYYVKMKLIERKFFAGAHPEWELLSEQRGRRWLRKAHLSVHWEPFILPVFPYQLQ